MPSRIILTDLPCAILDLIYRLMRGSDRCRAAQVCKELAVVHSKCTWHSLICSMHRLAHRGRYCEVPHWSADLQLLKSHLQRRMLLDLVSLTVSLDAPCFEAEKTPWVAATNDSFSYASLRHLRISASQPRNFGRPAAHALTRIVAAFPSLEAVGFCGIRNLGLTTLMAVFNQSRKQLHHVEILNCRLMPNALSRLARWLSSDQTTVWPPKLRHLHMTGIKDALYICMAMNPSMPLIALPPTVEYLDICEDIRHLRHEQLYLLLHKNQSLRTIVTFPHDAGRVQAYANAACPDSGLKIDTAAAICAAKNLTGPGV